MFWLSSKQLENMGHIIVSGIIYGQSIEEIISKKEETTPQNTFSEGLKKLDPFRLANSGCMNFCSGQTFHDNLVAHEREINEIVNINRESSSLCWDYYKNSRAKLFCGSIR